MACPAIAAMSQFHAPGRRTWRSVVHAFGAAFDNRDLVVACVIGDGEAETCPLEGSWKGVNFLNPVHHGAGLPIIHLNGYKISGPTVQGRTSEQALKALYIGRGYKPYLSKATILKPCIGFLPERWTIALRRFKSLNGAAVMGSRSNPSGL